MPFHIRLADRNEPNVTPALADRALKSVLMVELFQGAAFGIGVASVLFGVVWLLQLNGFGY